MQQPITRHQLIWGIGLLGGAAIATACEPTRSNITPRVSSTVPSEQRSPRSFASPSPAPAAATLPAGANQASLWTQLRQGTGYVVVMRHAIAPGTGDPANFRLDDCATQRNLSAAGRAQAIQIGEIFRQQAIPIARVLSSQWCRCLETAKLMNLAIVEPFPALNSFFQDSSTRSQQTEQVRQVILDHRTTAGVVIMVTHQVNITALTEVVPAPGGAVVLHSTEDQRLEVVGQLDL